MSEVSKYQLFSADWLAATDETLPPDCVKFIQGNGEAVVYRLNMEDETAVEIARWPEGSTPIKPRVQHHYRYGPWPTFRKWLTARLNPTQPKEQR